VKQPAPQARLRLIVWLVVLVPLAVVLLSTAYVAVAQPGCASCHSRDSAFAAATQKTAHSSVECVSCHVSPAPVDRVAFGLRQLFHMVLPVVSGEGRDWAAVEDAQCLACHKDIKTEVVSANGIRMDHDSCARDAECTDCHSAVGHGTATQWVRSYDMETCIACHVTEASTKCDTCHDEKDKQTRVSTGIFAVTHGKEWRTTHGMGNSATCSICHTAAKCENCHGVGLPHDKEFMGQHAAISANPAAKCFTCHETTFCADCHGIEMPHTKAFTRDHAARAESNPDLCKRCHADPDCAECHVKHVHPGGAVGSLRDPSAPSRGGE